MKDYADIDSKFRFVILAALRAKELLKGAKPKIKSKSKNLIRIAQEEVKQGLIEFELIETPVDEVREEEKNLIVSKELPRKPTLTLSIEKPAEPKVKPEKKAAKKVTKKKEKKEPKEPKEAKEVIKEVIKEAVEKKAKSAKPKK